MLDGCTAGDRSKPLRPGAHFQRLVSARCACRGLCGSSSSRRTLWPNGFFVGAVNRVGEELVKGARFYGSSYFCDPRGRVIAKASDTDDEVLVADLDLSVIEEVRMTWQFFRDRRPETYAEITALLP